MRRAAISTPPSAPPPIQSATTPLRRCRKAPSAGRERDAASARRIAGFRGERAPPRPQRPRQCAIPHQRHHAARRRHRLRQHFRHGLYRQHLAHYRRAAGRIRIAHGGARRHHHPQRHFQQFRQHQLLRRQPRHHRAEFRLRRHVLSVEHRDRHRKAVGCSSGLYRWRAVFPHRQLSADHRRHRKYAADAQRHPRFFAARRKVSLTHRRSSTPIRA